MFGAQYDHNTTRKYVIAFGNLFNDITVVRRDSDGNVVQNLEVPLRYGPIQKWYARIKSDPKFERKTAVNMPMMSFEIVSITYDPQRKQISSIKNKEIFTDSDYMKTQYVPVPYNIDFNLSVLARNAADAAYIIEQILPYFRPEFTTSVNLIPEMGITKDTPVILNSVDIEDSYEGDFQTRRVLVHTLNFTVKGYFYGPVSRSGVIKRAITRIYPDTDQNINKLETITVTPAQYANGAPLYSPSANAALSVPISQISANSDYGFSTDITVG